MLIENKITEFEKALKEAEKRIVLKNKKRNLNNLTPLQTQTLTALKNNKNLLIKPTDKNLGPAIMDTQLYIRQVLT
jgi:hypothetical protein